MSTIALDTAKLKRLFQDTPCTDGTHAQESHTHIMPDTSKPNVGKPHCPYPDKCVVVSKSSDFYAVVHATNPLHAGFNLWPPTEMSSLAVSRARVIVESGMWAIQKRQQSIHRGDDSEDCEDGDNDGGISVGMEASQVGIHEATANGNDHC